jgi:hypothetical protein
MLDFLEFILGIAEILSSWRFFLCVLAAALGVALIYWLVPGTTWRLVLSIPLMLTGVVVGIRWERQ